MGTQEATLIDVVNHKVSLDKARLINDMITLHLQPRPKWLPRFIWFHLINRLLILKIEAKGYIKPKSEVQP